MQFVEESRVIVDDNTQCIRIVPRTTVVQGPHPSMFHHYRTTVAVLDYTGNDASAINEDIWQSPTAYDDGGRIVYDYPTNMGIAGDPADGLINPNNPGKPFNENFNVTTGQWQSMILLMPFWVKITRGEPVKWLSGRAFASSEPFNNGDVEMASTNFKLEFDESLSMTLNSTDVEDTGSGGPPPGDRDLTGFEILDRSPIMDPVVPPYNYVEPEIPITVSYPLNSEAPSGMLFINLTNEETYLNLNFTRYNLELNKKDIQEQFETEFTEYIPDERYTFETINEYSEFVDGGGLDG